MWEGVFAWLAVGVGLIAAGLWLIASLVKVPPFPGVGLDSGPHVFEPVRRPIARAAALNAWAAGVTAVAVFLQAASLAAHRFGA